MGYLEILVKGYLKYPMLDGNGGLVRSRRLERGKSGLRVSRFVFVVITTLALICSAAIRTKAGGRSQQLRDDFRPPRSDIGGGSETGRDGLGKDRISIKDVEIPYILGRKGCVRRALMDMSG